MTPELRAKLQTELTRLTERDTPSSRDRFAEGFWRNVENWEERFRTNSAQALDELGQAQLARVLVAEHHGSPVYAQALREDFAQRTGKVFGTQVVKAA